MMQGLISIKGTFKIYETLKFWKTDAVLITAIYTNLFKVVPQSCACH